MCNKAVTSDDIDKMFPKPQKGVRDPLAVRKGIKTPFVQFPLPKRIARRLRNLGWVRNEKEMREAIWKFMYQDRDLREFFARFHPRNKSRMARGLAPIVGRGQYTGRRFKFEIEHGFEVGHGGDIYHLDEISIITPILHVEY